MLLYAMSILELDARAAEAVKHIRNFLNQNGRMPSVRELMQAMGYKSPRSASVMLEKLIDQGVLNRCPRTRKLNFNDGVLTQSNNTSTVEIPLIGTTSCSGPLFAEESIEGYFRISSQLAPNGGQYFFLKTQGDSMNLAGINDGDIVLIRQQNTAKSGDLVLALIDDEATIKKFFPEDGLIILKPCSSNPIHKPFILTHDLQIQGVVVRAFSNL